MDANFIVAEFSLKLIILWTQNLTLTNGAVTAAPQETRDLTCKVARDQLPQTLLAGCSLAKLSLAELQDLKQYDWSSFDSEFLINRSCSSLN